VEDRVTQRGAALLEHAIDVLVTERQVSDLSVSPQEFMLGGHP
jgi:hypothetical protein